MLEAKGITRNREYTKCQVTLTKLMKKDATVEVANSSCIRLCSQLAGPLQEAGYPSRIVSSRSP